MRTIDDYLDAARQINAIPSDRALSRALGLGGPAANQWRTKRAWPSDQTMVRIAEMAGIDPERALLDLCVWRCADTEAGPVYSSIARKVSAAAIAFLMLGILALGTNRAQAAAPSRALYIMENIWHRLVGGLLTLFSPFKHKVKRGSWETPPGNPAAVVC